MKGILEKTTRGWVVKEIIGRGSEVILTKNTYPLHESDASNMDEAVRLGEHGEVEFELVMGIDSIFNTTKPFAKIVYPMLDRLKAHLASITPEQFDAEIDDIIKNDTSVMLVCNECGMELVNCKCVFSVREMDLHCAEDIEISDEEIEEASRQINYGGGSEGWIKDAFIKGAKWYREQLKKK